MEMQIIAMYVICDEVLKQVGHRDNIQAQISCAEIITTHLVAAQWFGNNIQSARHFLASTGMIQNMLSKSRFNRRLHAIPSSIWEALFQMIAQRNIDQEKSKEFLIDSFPIPVCHNIRIRRSKIYTDEIYRGYTASKKQYFFGLKVHMITTTCGEPVEIAFSPGSEHDLKIFKQMNLSLPEGSTIYADKAYNEYEFEDLAKDGGNIRICPQRKKNSKRQVSQALEFITNHTRKRIETTFSSITRLFPKKIHAVRAKGFELKVLTFILAYAIQSMIAG
jgi:IS5 family transposase